MNSVIVKRVISEGEFMVRTGKTVREIAKVFGLSKSTIHKDLRERLLEVDVDLYKKVSSILQEHIDIRHIRGGESTRLKFLTKNAN